VFRVEGRSGPNATLFKLDDEVYYAGSRTGRVGNMHD